MSGVVTERINDMERTLRMSSRLQGRKVAPLRGVVFREDGTLSVDDVAVGTIEDGERR